MPAIVTRADVQLGKPYAEYREILRYDFWYSCAYCSISEAEAQGITFEIDHYCPQSLALDGTHHYHNLMWSCDTCNRHKGNVWETEERQLQGYRFIRPDLDDPNDHYELDGGLTLKPITIPGKYTVEMLYLDRKALREIRAIRQRLGEAQSTILAGIQSLRNVSIDRISPARRAQYLQAMTAALSQHTQLRNQTDSELTARVLNHSPLLDPDPDKDAHTAARREYLVSIGARIVRRGVSDRAATRDKTG